MDVLTFLEKGIMWLLLCPATVDTVALCSPDSRVWRCWWRCSPVARPHWCYTETVGETEEREREDLYKVKSDSWVNGEQNMGNSSLLCLIVIGQLRSVVKYICTLMSNWPQATDFIQSGVHFSSLVPVSHDTVI